MSTGTEKKRVRGPDKGKRARGAGGARVGAGRKRTVPEGDRLGVVSIRASAGTREAFRALAAERGETAGECLASAVGALRWQGKVDAESASRRATASEFSELRKENPSQVVVSHSEID